jgi:7-cyano-7-deazaguanine synthase in queuosine biosynthesis
MAEVKTVALYSGGIDSYCMSCLTDPDVLLYVLMGGRYGYLEHHVLRTPPGMERRLKMVDMSGIGDWELPGSLVIPGRNAMLALIGANYGDVILMASVDSSTGNDKDPEFCQRMNRLFEHMFAPQRWLPCGRVVILDVPVFHLTKTELVGAAIASGHPAQEIADNTFSCYEPRRGRVCGKCPPCGRKWACLSVYGADVGYNGREALRHYVEEQEMGNPANRSPRFIRDLMDAWEGRRREVPVPA